MRIQWVNVKFRNFNLRSLGNRNVSAIASIIFERDGLIKSNRVISFVGICQFDIESIRNGLKLSKMSESKICGQDEPLWSGHSNRSACEINSTNL